MSHQPLPPASRGDAPASSGVAALARQVLECPHCHNQVLTQADGSCPACRRDPADTAGLDLNQTAVLVFQEDTLPPLCPVCAGAADTELLLDFIEPSGSAPAASGFRGLIAPLLALASRTQPKTLPLRVVLHLPLCLSCRDAGHRPRVLTVRYREQGARLVVHRQFRSQLEQLNPRR